VRCGTLEVQMTDIRNNHPDVYTIKSLIDSKPKNWKTEEIVKQTKFTANRVKKLLTLCRNLNYITQINREWVSPIHYDELFKLNEIRINEHKKNKNKEYYILNPQKYQRYNKTDPQKEVVVSEFGNIPKPKQKLSKNFCVSSPNSVFQLAEFMGLRSV
jgi:hypothetical protein